MLGQSYAHDIIRKYVISFGTLFNNIKLMRSDETGVQQWISVPLSFSSKEKWMTRLSDPNASQQISITLPRLGYDLITMTYAPERKLNTMNRHVAKFTSNSTHVNTMYEAVPYDFQFAVYLYSRNAADAANIIEQILPFFTPEFTLTINNLTDLDIDTDIPIRIDGVSKEDMYEGAFETARLLIWTLDFTLKGVLYGPTQNSKIIKKAYVDFFIPSSYIRYHKGTLAANSTSNSVVFLQANTSTRTSNIYNNFGKIEILSGPATGNIRSIIAHNGDSQTISVNAFSSTPLDTWKYVIAYRAERDTNITLDQLSRVPTASRIYTIPGLTANGDPTTNSSLSVSESLIEADDDFGIIQTKTFFHDHPTLAGTRRNLLNGNDEDV